MTTPDATPLARYEPGPLIARGGMGELYRARMIGAAGWTRDVVLKMVLPHLGGDPEFIERFRDEARIAASLRHGNIVSVLDFGLLDGIPFLAMDWVDGWDLRQVIRTLRERGERMPHGLALFVGVEVCRALTHVHNVTDDDGRALGLVHRDISPSNLLIARTGEVKLTDFGIARSVTQTVRTETGQLRGKVAYMSPEQASGRPVDARSDLFSLGVVLYELLAGVRPFEAEGDVETLARVQRAEFAPLATVAPELDADVVAVVERAMARDPDDRWPDADAMQVALLGVLFRETGPVTARNLAAWATQTLPPRPAPAPAPRDETATVAPAPRTFGTGSGSVRRRAGGAGPGRDMGTGSAPGGASSAGLPSYVTGSVPVSGAADADAGSVPSSGGAVHVPGPGRTRRRAVTVIGVSLAGIISILVFSFMFTPAPARGTLEVRSTPDGASVYIDGVLMGVTTLRHPLLAGEHQVRVVADGHAPHVETVRVDARGTHTLAPLLAPLPVPVTLDSVPAGAWVTIEGREDRVVAGNTVRLVPGVPVRVRMELEGYAPWEGEVVPDAQRPRVVTRLEALADAGRGEAAGAADGDPDVPTTDEVAGRAGSSRGVTSGTGLGNVRPPRVGRDEMRTASVTADAGPGEVEGLPGRVILFFPEPPMVGELRVGSTDLGRVETGQTIELPQGSHRIEVRNALNPSVHRANVQVTSGQAQRHTVLWQP